MFLNGNEPTLIHYKSNPQPYNIDPYNTRMQPNCFLSHPDRLPHRCSESDNRQNPNGKHHQHHLYFWTTTCFKRLCIRIWGKITRILVPEVPLSFRHLTRLALAVCCRYTRHYGPIIRRCPIKNDVRWLMQYSIYVGTSCYCACVRITRFILSEMIFTRCLSCLCDSSQQENYRPISGIRCTLRIVDLFKDIRRLPS